MKNNKLRLCIYDFETTGFFTSSTQPIEVAIKVIEKDGTESNYHSYINCPYPLNAQIVRLTGITDKTLKEKGRPIMEVMKEVAEIIMQPDTLVIGHNIVTFDNHFLNRYLEALKYPKLERQFCHDTYGCMKAEVISLDRKSTNEPDWSYFPRAISKKSNGVGCTLTDACNYYGVKREARMHNAIADVDYTYRVYLKQIKKTDPEVIKKRVSEAIAKVQKREALFNHHLGNLVESYEKNEISMDELLKGLRFAEQIPIQNDKDNKELKKINTLRKEEYKRVDTQKKHYESTIRILKESKLNFTETKTGTVREIFFPNGTSRKYYCKD